MQTNVFTGCNLIEAGVIIEEAIRLVDCYNLTENLVQPESRCVLGNGIGPMLNYQAIYLLNMATKRMLGDIPEDRGAGDFYIHATIHQLYWGYTRRLLDCDAGLLPRRDAQLEALLRRLVARNLDHAHNLNFATMPGDQWALLIDVGAILLQREFPTGPRPFNAVLETEGWPDTQAEWLHGLWLQLQQETAVLGAYHC